MFIQVSIFREDAVISIYRTVSRQVCFRNILSYQYKFALFCEILIYMTMTECD